MQRWILYGLVCVAFYMSLYISRTVFERMPHLEDEIAYLHQAQIFARGEIVQDSPSPRSVYWKPFVVDFGGKRFSKYTPGWSALLAVGVKLGNPSIVNAWFAALSIAFLARLGSLIYNRETALFAAALLTFSPAFLLLSGSLMGHTAALCAGLAFALGYLKLAQGERAHGWAVLAGLGLGVLSANRALTALALVAPFALWSALRLWAAMRQAHLWRTLSPLLLMALVALPFALTVPLYRYAATGDPTLNTYTLVWTYDRVGFGAAYGRSGHTPLKGLGNAANDLTLLAADLFGWQWGALNPTQREHLLLHASRYPGVGFSWVLLPLGVWLGWRMGGTRRRNTYILLALPVSLIAAYMLYWVGSQRYSTRYYFEAFGALALLSAIVPAWLIQRAPRWRIAVYGAFVLITSLSLLSYTLPRVRLLYGFNGVSQSVINGVNGLRQTDKPLLVILTQQPYSQTMTWRANGTLLVVTGAYLDSEIVLARDQADKRHRTEILARFPDHEVLDLVGAGSHSWLAGATPP